MDMVQSNNQDDPMATPDPLSPLLVGFIVLAAKLLGGLIIFKIEKSKNGENGLTSPAVPGFPCLSLQLVTRCTSTNIICASDLGRPVTVEASCI